MQSIYLFIFIYLFIYLFIFILNKTEHFLKLFWEGS